MLRWSQLFRDLTVLQVVGLTMLDNFPYVVQLLLIKISSVLLSSSICKGLSFNLKLLVLFKWFTTIVLWYWQLVTTWFLIMKYEKNSFVELLFFISGSQNTIACVQTPSRDQLGGQAHLDSIAKLRATFFLFILEHTVSLIKYLKSKIRLKLILWYRIYVSYKIYGI